MKTTKKYYSKGTKFLYLFILLMMFYAFPNSSYGLGKKEKQATKANDEIYYSPAGTYSDWYFPADKTYLSLEWTFVPVADPPASLAAEGLLHYYAYNFALVNSSPSVGGGYAGFQTNGIFKDIQEGKVINFSIWGSNAGKTNGLLNTGNGESGGVQIMYKYKWVINHKYHFQLKQGPSGTDSLGKWWGLWVKDENTGISTFVGEQRVVSHINGKDATSWGNHTSMFGEDLHWWKTLNGDKKYTDRSVFQCSAMAAIAITANNGTIKPLKFTNYTNSGKSVTGDNGFKSVNSIVTIYQDSVNFGVQHNLGTWASPAPNYLKKNK